MAPKFLPGKEQKARSRTMKGLCTRNTEGEERLSEWIRLRLDEGEWAGKF